MNLHTLNLKQSQGSLNRVYFDLPSTHRPVVLYLRQREGRSLPPSYRSGLAFFLAFMLVSLVGISVVDALSLAEARRTQLHTEIMQTYEELSQELQDYTLVDTVEPSREISTNFSRLREDPLLLRNTIHPNTSILKAYQAPQNPQAQLLEIGLDINQGYQAFRSFLNDWQSDNSQTLTHKLRSMGRSEELALSAWQGVFRRLGKLPSVTEKKSFRNSLKLISGLTEFLSDFKQALPVMLSFLGEEEPQRIIILIQDPYTRRATGGALSVGIELLLDEGELLSQKAFHVDEYDQLLKIDLQPPQGLEDLTDRWNLKTSNVLLDPIASAEQFHWFWQREARSSVDTIIFVNSSAFEKFLSNDQTESGTEELMTYGNSIAIKWSKLIESNHHDELKIMALDLLKRSLDVFADPQRLINAWPVLVDLYTQKQLIVTSTSPIMEKKLLTLGLNPPIIPFEDGEDFLLVANLNTNNRPVDRWIEESRKLHTTITEKGVIRHLLSVKRTHAGNNQSGTEASIVQILVPKGSMLTRVEGLLLSEIRSSSTEDATMWSYEENILPGESTEKAFYYEIPWTFDTSSVDNYRLAIIKQPGSENVVFEHHIKLPASLSLFQILPETPIQILDRDLQIRVVAGRNPL